MRASGNLAGVEFIAPPAFHAQEEQWKEIITESGYFFTRHAMRFFSSRIDWNSLGRTESGVWLFVTSEKSPYSPRVYTVRRWDKDSGIGLASQEGQFETIKQANSWLIRSDALVSQ